jgi:hypothetical protein
LVVDTRGACSHLDFRLARKCDCRVFFNPLDSEEDKRKDFRGRLMGHHFKQVGFKFGRWLDVIYMERLI